MSSRARDEQKANSSYCKIQIVQESEDVSTTVSHMCYDSQWVLDIEGLCVHNSLNWLFERDCSQVINKSQESRTNEIQEAITSNPIQFRWPATGPRHGEKPQWHVNSASKMIFELGRHFDRWNLFKHLRAIDGDWIMILKKIKWPCRRKSLATATFNTE